MGGSVSLYQVCCECPGQARIILCGLEESGRSAVIQQFRDGFRADRASIRAQPGKVGFNVETVQYHQMQFTVWDVGSHGAFERLHRPYFKGTEALVFVIDSTSADRLPTAREELRAMLVEEELAEAVILILANDKGRVGLSQEKLAEHLTVADLAKRRFWAVLPCNATDGKGIDDALQWILDHLPAPTRRKCSPCCAHELCCMGLRK